MKKRIIYTTIVALLSINLLFGKTLERDSNGDFIIMKENITLLELLKDYAKLLGTNIIIGTSLKDTQIVVVGPKKIKQADIEAYITSATHSTGLTLINKKELNLIHVIASRNVRFNATEQYFDINKVPETFNYIQFIYKVKHIDGHGLARNFRPFMTRYGRMMHNKLSNTITIQDTGVNIKRAYKIITMLDTKEATIDHKAITAINKKYEIKEKGKINLLSSYQKNSVIFLIIFTMMGAIIGFLTRGFLIRRIEGGL